MSCSYYFWKTVFFLVHAIIHLFGYLIPRFFRFLVRCLTCQPCRDYSGNYIYRPEDQVRVIHNREVTEVVEDVFGLVDVRESLKEDKQYCCQTAEEKKKLMARAAKKLLFYDRPFYNAHVSTIMGIKRPTEEITYAREQTHSWDGCPIALDWLYVDGESPICPHHTCTIAGSEPYQDTFGEGERVPSPVPFGSKNYNNKEQPEKEESRYFPYFPYLPRFFSSSSSSSSNDEDESSQRVASPPLAPAPSVLTSPSRAFMGTKVKGVIVIAPGLSSTSQTSYIRRVVRALHEKKYHVCVINTRGFGGSAASTKFMINSAYTKDFRTVIRRFFSKDAITKRFGCAFPVIGLGLSNGGATLSKYLGETGRDGEEPHLDAAITCHAPNDFVHVVEHMNRGTMQKCIYQPDMCSDVKSYIFRHEEFQHIPNIDTEYVFKQGNIHRFTRVIHFDEHIFSKTSGYRSIHQYHMDASPVLWLPYTPIPTLVLASFDDPVIGRTVMPHRWQEMCANNPRLVSVEVRQGGHLGFLQGPFDELLSRPDWLHRFVIQRMDAVCLYWRSIQQNPEKSTGLMQIIPETWEKYYKEMEHELGCPTTLPTPNSCTFNVNTPYFTSRTTKRLPKEYLYRSYFDAPSLNSPRDSPDDPVAEKSSSNVVTGLRDGSVSVEIPANPPIQEFNEKARPIGEVLRTATRVPILTNCDYYVDPRVYMVTSPGEV